MKIAIVGAGISGLTAAYVLHPHHDVTVFEQDARAGGHSHTVVVADEQGPLPIDTGFIVYNERTYPGFTALLARLGVATQPSEMSFAVTCDRCRLTYSGRGLAGLTAQKRRVFDPRFLRMLLDVARFNAWATALRHDTALQDVTLGSALRDRGFSRWFERHYLLPMTSAIWSASFAQAAEIPLGPFLTFFHNHGLLQVRDQPQWRTITGGSRCYVQALVEPLGSRVRLAALVQRVHRRPNGVDLTLANGESIACDRVVLATHSDQTLRLLGDASDEERTCLSAIPYTANQAVLHTDVRVLPPRERAWSSWNYHVADCTAAGEPPRLTYFMNRLQRLATRRIFCVTLNDDGRIDPATVIARIAYHHPAYSIRGVDARRRLRRLSGARHTFFCGAYLGNGFHEDGVQSALAVARALNVPEGL